MSELLSMRGVSKSYQSGVRGCSATVSVLRDIDLSVYAGEVVSIAAGPASGKTTLLMCAAGLMRPDCGTVSWFGGAPSRDVAAKPEGIAYTGDRPFPYAFLSARETLEYAAIVRDLPLRDNGARVATVLARTGLSALADRRVDSLEAGALARLALAAALLAQPRLLVVDDITAGCDAASASELAALVRGVAATSGAAIVTGRLATALETPGPFGPPATVRRLSLIGGCLRANVEHEPVSTHRSLPPRARVAEASQRSAGENEGG